MRNILAIFKREFLSFFVSPIAYMVITGFILLAGYFFFGGLFSFTVWVSRYGSMAMNRPDLMNLNQAVVQGFYHTLIVVLVFLIPFLTMRTIAEERRRGTYELLATSPLAVHEIVIGKFLGVSAVVGAMLLAVFIFPLVLCFFGNPENFPEFLRGAATSFGAPEIAPIVSGFFALLLCALAFVSIGIATSAITENQIVAGVSGMVILLLLYVIQGMAESVGGLGEQVLVAISPINYAREMIDGAISIKSLVYFFSLISLGLFFSVRALEGQRWR